MRLFSNMLTFNRVRDGEDGKQGAMPVPEGSWDKNKTYLRDQYKTPIVEYLGLMYTLNKEGEFQGINPKDDYAENGKNGTWVLVPDYELLIVKALVANFGKIGGAIFYKDLMMSQYGVDKNGNPSNNYDQYPFNFTPNFKIDWETGSGYMRGNLQRTIFDLTYTPSDYVLDVVSYGLFRFNTKEYEQKIVYLPSLPIAIGSDIVVYHGDSSLQSELIIKADKDALITGESGVEKEIVLMRFQGVRLIAVDAIGFKTVWRYQRI